MAEQTVPNPSLEDASDTSWMPKADMEFKTDEEAYQFYNNYAKIVGFSVRKAWINRRSSGLIISRTYVCYKEGFQGNKKDEGEVKKPRKNERTGCLAHMIIKVTESGRYRVSEFHPMHNHELVPSAKADMLKSHRVVKRNRDVVANVASDKAKLEYLVRQAGGYKLVTFVSVEDAAGKSWAPKVDMEFEDDEMAHQFYAEYGRRVGFDVRKAWVNKRSSGVIISRTYVCHKEGFYLNKKEESQVQKHQLRPSDRTGCLARMTVKLAKNGKYRVSEFQQMHNHEFATARTAHMLKSHRVSMKAKAERVGSVDDTRMAQKASQENVGGHGEALMASYLMLRGNGVASKYKDVRRTGDLGAILQYMQERQAEDRSFYYAIQVDDEDQIANVFWADGKSGIDFSYFNDVICFDTTYNANNYGRPFALFYGVNHHKQIVFFGAAFLYNETEDSFKWLFQTFKAAMNGKQPSMILIDENEAMCNAIDSVWQGTIRRTCLWHVYHNATKYIKQVFQGSRSFGSDFSRCIYDCEEEEEFLSSWEKMLEKYDLKDNIWLNKLFDDRKKWAVPYGREIFCADMKSVQRRESLNSMLKEYLSPEKDLLQFLKHYEGRVEECRHAEVNADFHATQSTSLMASSRMLRQAANAYTNAVFDMFQREFEMSMDCMVYNYNGSESRYECKVTSEDCPKEYLVRFDSLDGTLMCSCKMFEHIGIQCRHVLKTLDISNVKELPSQYFIKRWRKDAKAGSLGESRDCLSDVSLESSKAYYSSLRRIFSRIAARAAETVEGYMFIENRSDQLMDQVLQILKTGPPKEP